MAKTTKSKTKFWTDDKIKRAIHLFNSGKSWQEIADTMGSTRESVARTVRKFKAGKRNGSHPYADFTRESLGSIIKEKSHTEGMFFVTAALPTDPTDGQLRDKWYVGANLHTEGFAAIQSFCRHNSASLIIHPLPAQVSALKDQPHHYDPVLKPYMKNFATEYVFNQYLRSLDIGINPQQVNPITGLGRMRGEGDRKSSILIAHTKQNMELYPTGNNSLPRMVHTTGCITYPAYKNNRIGRIAEEDHVIGGLVVIIKGTKFFVHQVQIKADDGSFNYMGNRYFADGTVKSEPAEAMKLGDIHFGRHSEVALQLTYEMFNLLKPKLVFVEDVFDGASVNPHSWADMFTRGTPEAQFASLANELEICRQGLEEVREQMPVGSELLITASNHNDFLDRFLRKGLYVNDPVNYAIGHRMIVDKLDGKDPLEVRLDPDQRYTWLTANDDVIVEGVNMASHGHMGPNGSKGGHTGLELSYDSAMFAHTHTPRIMHRSWWVGHLSEPRHGYNEGASSWVQCNGAVFKNGERCLYFIIEGEWR